MTMAEPETPRWESAKQGMSYVVWNDEVQTSLRLTHIKRSRSELTGELTVKCNIAGVKARGGVMHQARFNVLSSTTRASLARMLQKRTPNHPDFDWFDALEWLSQLVIEGEQKGEEFIHLGAEPPIPLADTWLVEPIALKEQPAMIFGPGGSGKSLFALTCALSVALGREIIPGMPPTVHGPVMFLDWETSANTINYRCHAIAAGCSCELEPDNFIYRRSVKPLADDVEELCAVVALKKVVLVVIDSAAYAMGAQGEYGDANEATLRMHEALRLMNTASLVVDHVAKMDQRRVAGTASPYGSAYKTNAVRNSWEIRKAEGGINLYHAKANDMALLDPIGLNLEWTTSVVRFTKVEVAEPARQVEGADSRELISDHLSDGAKRSPATIAKELDLNAATVRSTLRRMKDAGQVYDGDGMYWRDKTVIKFQRPGMFDD